MTQEEKGRINDWIIENAKRFKNTNQNFEFKTYSDLIEFVTNAVAAERSRLLEEAGMPDDGELSEILHSLTKEHKPHSIDPFGVYERMAVITQLAMKEVRSRCSSLVMKEREKATIKAIGWMVGNPLTAETVQQAEKNLDYKLHVVKALYKRLKKEGGGE